MASIEERKGKKGTAFRVLFRDAAGRRRGIFFDSDYSRTEVEKARQAVEGYLRSKKLDEPLDRATRLYFENATPDVMKRFATVDFDVVKRAQTVLGAWKEFVAFKAQEGVKPATLEHYETTFRRLAPYITEQTTFADLTTAFVQELRNELSEIYAKPTLSSTITDWRTFANWSVERGYATRNPFMDVVRGSTVNKLRDFQVPAEWTEKILDACPSQTLRTLYALWRHAALRLREPLQLKKESINLESKRLFVYATKTERYKTGGLREAPISPLLARELGAQLREVPKGEENLIYTGRGIDFNSVFRKIIEQAGLAPWDKLFQNLRSSCENDWIAMGIPPHVVASWLGHSVKTQEAYYLRVLPEYFDRVVG